MGRYPFSLAATFLTGMFVGALAMGGWSRAPNSERLAEPGPQPVAKVPSERPVGAVDDAALTVFSRDVPAAASDQASHEGQADGDRLRELSAAWTRMQEDLLRLNGRVAGLEQRLAASAPTDEFARPERPTTEDDRKTLLVAAGVSLDLAAQIVSLQAQNELNRLELRDVALREGWFGSDRYREEVGQLDEQRPDLRAEIGDEAYDRYLYSAGSDNRVRISAVIPGSAAEEVGLSAGDLIETYDNGRIFTFSGLRDATAAGERGELVPVDIRRQDGSRVQAWLPRGPLGVRLDLTRADPEA